MIVTINPSKISGTVHAPASKSSMQRACAAALLHEGETILINPGKCNDDLAALDVIEKLGAIITKLDDNKLSIKSKGFPPGSSPTGGDQERAINCGESGLGLRMFAPIAALSSNQIILNGSGSLLQRPMDFFDEIFPLLKIEVESNNGKLPIKIKGPLTPANITIDGSLSSQFLTGLLMAYAASLRLSRNIGREKKIPVSIKVINLKSKPYIDLTLLVMKHFGWNVENRNYEEFIFKQSVSKVSPPTGGGDLEGAVTYTVEGDWSGAAFLLVSGAIAGSVTVKGLDVFSAQADKKILEALSNCGAITSISEDEIVVSNAPLKAFHFNATDCPDLFPPLVALAAYCNGKTVIEGVNRLAHKESDRAITLQEEFAKIGLVIQLQDDLMIIEGGELNGATVHSRHDHRIAMSCAVAALRANGETVIVDAEAVNKSYPDFYDHLQKLNTRLQKS